MRDEKGREMVALTVYVLPNDSLAFAQYTAVVGIPGGTLIRDFVAAKAEEFRVTHPEKWKKVKRIVRKTAE